MITPARILCTLALFIAFAISTKDAIAAESVIDVMTFNIRYNNPGDGANAWPKRKDFVADVIKKSGATIVGMQEARSEQVDDLEKRLPTFNWYGVGRDDGKQQGEFVPIFYRKDLYDRLDANTFWLSLTPEKPGSKSWDAAITRIMCWVKLKEKVTGNVFFVFNTHYDHIGRNARTNSSRLILKKMTAIAGNTPLVLMGDFNTRPGSKPYQTLTGKDAPEGSLKLVDAKTISKAKHEGPDSTWNGFRAIVPGRRIDFVFVRPGATILSHRILAEKRDGRFASDHLPIVSQWKLP